MDLDSHVGHLVREGRLLAEAAMAGEGTEPVAACPGWSLRDLVLHVGVVHQWALAALTSAGRPPATSKDELLGAVSLGYSELPGWYAEQNRALADTLLEARQHDEIWTLWEDRTIGAAFWARRQAHETAVHRYDAQHATGTPSAFDRALAGDGIDELLTMAALSQRRWPVRDHVRLGVHARDSEQAWVLDVRGHERALERDAGPADTMLDGTAGEVLTFLWNRPLKEPPRRSGDVGLWDTWTDLVQIH